MAAELSPWALRRGEWLPSAVRTVKLEIPGGYAAVTRARREVLAAFEGLLSPDEQADLALVVSELVANSVRHGGMMGSEDRITLHAAIAPDRLRVEVCDCGHGFERPQTPQPRDFEAGGGGLGLVLLERLAAAWGVAVEDEVCVWAEFAR
jgi:anti-sigma regulatory factor (Ser/Thr protein kinase)